MTMLGSPTSGDIRHEGDWFAEGGTTRLLQVDELILRQLSDDNDNIQSINSHLALAPSKHVRATLTLLGGAFGDPACIEQVLSAAAGVELLHLSSLIHDDVIDDADIRRGKPTVHRHWGTHVASLSGGYVFTRACWLINALGDDRIRTEFASIVATVCIGQLMEIENTRNVALTVDRYYATIERKTSSLLGFAAFVGGIAACAPESDIAALKMYGVRFGTLYQVLDDVLDIMAEARSAAKSPGGDLRRGIYTLPVLLALQGDSPGARELCGLLSTGRKLDGEPLARALELVRSSHGIRDAVREAQRIGDDALAALASLPECAPTRSLRRLVHTRLQLAVDSEGSAG